MNKRRVFVSFDYDNDVSLKHFLIGQSRNSDSPFEIYDYSVKEHLHGNWKAKAREKIKMASVVVVLCGKDTHNAVGVSEELRIAREEGKEYFLLRGSNKYRCTKPKSARLGDKMYPWSWNNLKLLISGRR